MLFGMLNEIENNRYNESWTVIDRSEVPSGRRLHNLTWVFKHKRCGKTKGTTLRSRVHNDSAD